MQLIKIKNQIYEYSAGLLRKAFLFAVMRGDDGNNYICEFNTLNKAAGNERWITVHPGGDPSSKGIHVLVREHHDGSYHVIGGAGGSLNYLRITDLKTKEEYEAIRLKRAAEEKARKKTLTPEQKAQEKTERGKIKQKKDEINVQKIQAQKKVIEQAAQTYGWKDYEYKPIEGLSEKAQQRSENLHHKELWKKVVSAGKEAKERIRLDADKRAELGLGELPLHGNKTTEEEATIGYTDLVPDHEERGLGYKNMLARVPEEELKQKLSLVNIDETKKELELLQQKSKELQELQQVPSLLYELQAKAKQAQIDAAEAYQRGDESAPKRFLEAQTAIMKSSDFSNLMKNKPEQADSIAQKMAGNKAYQEEVKKAREKVTGQVQNLQTSSLDTDLDFLKALKTAELEIKGLEAEKQEDITSIPGYGLRVEAKDIDKDALERIKQDISADEQSDIARSFLSEVEKTEEKPDLLDALDTKPQSIRRYIALGHYNSINNFSQILARDYMIDRDVADTLGVQASAQVIASTLREKLPAEEVDKIKEGLKKYNIESHVDAAENAMREANDHFEAIKQIEMGEAGHPRELEVLNELNLKRLDHIRKARQTLGTTLGELEGNSALLYELEHPSKKNIEVQAGKVSTEKLHQQARALGLSEEDYTITDDGRGGNILSIKNNAINKMIRNVDFEEAKKAQKIIDIKNGEQDQEGWLPSGIEGRPLTSYRDPETNEFSFPVALNIDKDSKGNAIGNSINDYIGARLANGEESEDIRRDLNSNSIKKYIPDEQVDNYRKELDKIFPDEEDVKDQAHKERMNDILRGYMAKQGAGNSDFHSQTIDIDSGKSYEALHQAMSEVNASGPVSLAFKDKLTAGEMAQLRKYHYYVTNKEIAPYSQESKKKEEAPKEKVEQLGLFGGVEEYEKPEEQKEATQWQKYVKTFGGDEEKAYQALQEHLQGQIIDKFKEQYNKISDKPIKAVPKFLENHKEFIRGTLSEKELDERLTHEKSKTAKQYAQVATRQAGKFATEEESRKERAERNQRLLQAGQFNLFSDEDFKAEGDEQKKELLSGQRWSIGKTAENQLKSIAPYISRNFENVKPGNAVKIPNDLSMSGKYIKQQRAIKAFGEAKRLGVFYGAGSGKSIISIGAFTNLHDQGKAKKAIYVVPSVVQGQFGAEMNRFTTPGKYKFHAKPGATYEERMKAYKDPENNMTVVTHQSMRDDIVKMVAEQQNSTIDAAADKLRRLSREQRKGVVREALNHHGIDFNMMVLDEGHDALNRKGKPNSLLANTLDALSDNTEYYMPMTGNPVKNDSSEAFDWATKIRPDKYKSREEFMNRYGISTSASKEGLKRELDPIFYSDRVDPGVKVTHKEEQIELSPEQKTAYKEIEKAYAKAKLAKLNGKIDVGAIKQLSADSFKDVPEEQQEEKAKKMQASLAMLRDSAMNRVVNAHPKSAKLSWLRDYAKCKKKEGKAGVIFAHNIKSVDSIAKILEKDGHRVAKITGADSAKDKEQKKLSFSPDDPSKATADIIVVSDAGATGMNLQRGQWLINYDTPDTAKTHEQRIARIKRLGQKQEIEVHDLVANTANEQNARRRLSRKYELADIYQSPSDLLDDTGLAHYINESRKEKEEIPKTQLKRPEPQELPQESKQKPQEVKKNARSYPLVKIGRTIYEYRDKKFYFKELLPTFIKIKGDIYEYSAGLVRLCKSKTPEHPYNGMSKEEFF